MVGDIDKSLVPETGGDETGESVGTAFDNEGLDAVVVDGVQECSDAAGCEVGGDVIDIAEAPVTRLIDYDSGARVG